MSWVELAIIFFVSHLLGDYLFQTDWQARHKFGGLGKSPVSRHALFSHVLTYTVAFVPALIWIGVETDPAVAVGAGLLVAIPHLGVDDGRLLRTYMRTVKKCPPPVPSGLTQAVDQSTHLIMLWATAVLVSVIA